MKLIIRMRNWFKRFRQRRMTKEVTPDWFFDYAKFMKNSKQFRKYAEGVAYSGFEPLYTDLMTPGCHWFQDPVKILNDYSLRDFERRQLERYIRTWRKHSIIIRLLGGR